MKVLVLTSSYPIDEKLTDGNFIRDLLMSIHEVSGDTFVVLAPHKGGAEFYEKSRGIEVVRFPYFYPYSLQDLAYDEGLPYKILNGILPKIQLPIFILLETLYAIHLLRSRKADIINSHWLVPQGLVGALCNLVFHMPHVATLHSSEITFLNKIPGGRHLVRFIIHHSDLIASVSQHRANEVIALLSPSDADAIKKITRIIPMGVEEGEQLDKDQKCVIRDKLGIHAEFVILFVGRFVEVKGCLFLLRAMTTIAKSIDSVVLLVVGTGPLERELTRFVCEEGLEKIVRFEGFVPHDQIPDYYKVADVLVVPSIIDQNGYQEGAPVVIIEGMQYGVAVVATNTPGIQELIRDGVNGLLVDQKDPEQIAERVLELFRDPSLRDRIASNIRVDRSRFLWKNIGREYSISYSEILRR
jgi:glycosyltransferase involved in cell wall biosynthesis